MATPDYVLTKGFEHKIDLHTDPVVLKAGSFVRPIEYRYLPNHIKDTNDCRINEWSGKIYCYTHYGLIPIPQELLRRR